MENDKSRRVLFPRRRADVREINSADVKCCRVVTTRSGSFYELLSFTRLQSLTQLQDLVKEGKRRGRKERVKEIIFVAISSLVTRQRGDKSSNWFEYKMFRICSSFSFILVHGKNNMVVSTR